MDWKSCISLYNYAIYLLLVEVKNNQTDTVFGNEIEIKDMQM